MATAISLAAATIAPHSWAGSWKGNSSRTLSLCLQKVSELGKFPRRRSQRLRRMCSHRWHNLVVQIRYQLRRLFFQSLGDIRYRTIEARGSFFHLAVEFGHTHPAGSGSMFTRELRLPGFIIIVGTLPVVKSG